MSTRAKREPASLKRYVVLLEILSQKIKKAKTDRKLYPVVVTDVDKIGKQMKTHYVGDIANGTTSGGYTILRIATLLSSGWNRIPSSTSLEDRTELVHGELYLAIKKKSCIQADGMIQQPVLKFQLIRMC